MIGSLNLRPKLGRRSYRRVDDRFLLVCIFDPTGITTVYENIALWQKFSRYRIEIFNLWPSGGNLLTVPNTIDLTDYAGLIVHCTASYDPDNLYQLDKGMTRPLEQYDGVKVLMKQDEHFHTNRLAKYIGRKKFDLAMTCIAPEERSKVYPARVVGDAQFL